MFIESLWRLNQRLKGTDNPPTVIAFIITAPTRHVNVDVLRNHTMFEDLRATSKELQDQMGPACSTPPPPAACPPTPSCCPTTRRCG